MSWHRSFAQTACRRGDAPLVDDLRIFTTEVALPCSNVTRTTIGGASSGYSPGRYQVQRGRRVGSPLRTHRLPVRRRMRAARRRSAVEDFAAATACAALNICRNQVMCLGRLQAAGRKNADLRRDARPVTRRRNSRDQDQLTDQFVTHSDKTVASHAAKVCAFYLHPITTSFALHPETPRGLTRSDT